MQLTYFRVDQGQNNKANLPEQKKKWSIPKQNVTYFPCVTKTGKKGMTRNGKPIPTNSRMTVHENRCKLPKFRQGVAVWEEGGMSSGLYREAILHEPFSDELLEGTPVTAH